VQPHGPYCLGGYSFSGVIALEMARALNDQGERVAFLAAVEPQLCESLWPASARCWGVRHA
jgi:thioesterase domain-containing protein